MSLLNDGDENSVRQRKGGVTGIVQELDVFMKVVDEVKEEPRAANGILSILCFSLIFFLLVGQLYEYFTNSEVEYKFSVDVDYEQALSLDIDMIIANPCSDLAIMPMGADSADSNPLEDLFGALLGDEKPKKTFINKNPTRFTMSPEEEKLWAALQKIHKEHFKPGTPLKPVNERTFVHSDVEAGLREAADAKQRLQVDELERLRKAKKKGREGDNALALPGAHNHEDDGGIMLMIGNGMRIFQIIAAGDDSSDVDEGTACRVSGKVPVIKGRGDRLTISVGKALNIGNLMAHFGDGNGNDGNISHRIERFHFGPHVWGLVTPLAGIEQIIEKPNIIFQYYIKVVPTKIYKRGAGALFGQPEMAYQYAVSYTQKHAKEGEHSHDGIVFDYEFADVVVEVFPVSLFVLTLITAISQFQRFSISLWFRSVTELLLRICSIVGGVFATSRFIETLASIYYRWRYPA